ncbi:MAG: response regulator [Akkermansiaceae bacterium]|nr:response regulator [Akkermansiaceae bacterium]
MQPKLPEPIAPNQVRVRKILVVDDEAPFTRLLKINLESTGRYLVQVENDPLLALPAALSFGPDLVVLDVMMPGMDGGDVASGFNQHAVLKRIPIIFLTATVRHSEVDDHVGNFGGLRFLAKPVNLSELLTCLDTHFGG